MPPLYNAYEAKLLHVLHSKLVKKTKRLPGLLSDPLFHGIRFLKENGLIILGDRSLLKKIGLFSQTTCPHILKVVYFQGRSAHAYSHWSISTGDLPTHTYFGLFLWATNPHILILVYFHGRPAHTYSHWSIFTGDLPF